MLKKILKVIMCIFIIFIILIICFVLFLRFGLGAKFDFELEAQYRSMAEDYYNNQEYFDKFAKEHSQEEFQVYKKTTYTGTEEDLKFLFDELGYVYVRIQGNGTIYFGKYDDSIATKELVYTEHTDYILNINAKIIKDLSVNWYIYTENLL